MNSRLVVRLTAPIVAISLLLLAIGLGTAWYVHHWQETVTQDLRINVSGIRAAEELEILIREARTRLDHFLITGDRAYLAQVRELRASIEYWLADAERWGITPQEQQFTSRVRTGLGHFWDDLERIINQAEGAGILDQIRRLIDGVLVREVLEPAHGYLDFNEEEVIDAIEKNQAFADQLVYALLFLGTCGSAGGLLAGFGFARGLSRSLVQAEQFAALGQLAAGMAHELRNPLTSMKILVQGALAAAGDENDEGEGMASRNLSGRDLAVLEEEITRLEQLTQSFLDFARPPKPEKHVVDLHPLVRQTLTLLTARTATGPATLELIAPPTPIRAAVDTAQFRQVVLNLVLNALDAMPAGGTVTVTLRRDGNEWSTVEVADRGAGLPPGLGERIFEPFTTTKEAGLGLGLSICRRIAAAHGGTLTGTNRVGGGAVFKFRLPALG
jgi:signal transduction histidine kinase